MHVNQIGEHFKIDLSFARRTQLLWRQSVLMEPIRMNYLYAQANFVQNYLWGMNTICNICTSVRSSRANLIYVEIYTKDARIKQQLILRKKRTAAL